MALNLTRSGILARMGGYHGLASGIKHGASDLFRRELTVVRSSEVSLSAFTFGVIQGKFKARGGLTLLGLPADLVSGAALHVIALLGFSRPYSHHLKAFGDGAFASFFTTTGYRVGERWATGAGFLPSMKSGIMGDDKPVSGGTSLADKELANLIRGEG